MEGVTLGGCVGAWLGRLRIQPGGQRKAPWCLAEGRVGDGTQASEPVGGIWSRHQLQVIDTGNFCRLPLTLPPTPAIGYKPTVRPGGRAGACEKLHRYR
jgi:hypothetical protein